MEHFKREMRGGDKGDSKLVGAEIPTNISDYLNLFCVVDSRSKTSILRPLIEKWAKKAKVKFPESKLINMTASMGYASWKERKNRRVSFDNVMKVQKRELTKKGVSEKAIFEILKKIEDAKNQED